MFFIASLTVQAHLGTPKLGVMKSSVLRGWQINNSVLTVTGYQYLKRFKPEFKEAKHHMRGV